MIRENVQVYIYALESQKVLMLKRTQERSGYWQPVCGGIEAGETLIETGIREVCEETGINNYRDLIRLEGDYKYLEEKNGHMMHMRDRCLLMLIDRSIEVNLSDEHVTYKWCDLDEVAALNDWQPMLSSIKMIKEIV